MSNVNIEYNLTFNNVSYFVYLSIVDEVLKIGLESASESLYWKGDFEAKYIEEITNRAGSYKSFPVFIKMFMSSLTKETESVLIDLISFKDLEQMKMKKMQQNSFNSSQTNMNESLNNNLSSDPSKINKKYFIMSYANEFEKVHYPLPLQFMPIPESEMMLRTIERMRKTVAMNKFSSNTSSTINFKEIEEIKQDNQNLKNKIRLLESQRKFGAVENDEYIKNSSQIKDEFENYKNISENKIKVLAKTVEDLKSKLSSQNVNQNTNQNEITQYIKELETKLEKASDIVTNERKQGQSYIDDKIREMERLQKDIHFLKENEKKLKVKINQLEKDLELANRKNFYDSKFKIGNSTPKSNYSYKSGSVKSGYSKYSNTSSKKLVAQSNTSTVKKNLLVNPYNKFKGINNKNYQPFKFFDKNKNSSMNKSNKSLKSNSSVASGDTLGNKSNTGSKYKNNFKNNYSPSQKSVNNSLNKFGSNNMNNYSNKNSKIPTSKPIPKVYQSKKFTPIINNYTKQNQNKMTSASSGNINKITETKIATNNNNNYNVNSLMEEKANIVSKIKLENDSKVLDSNDINERLGRIQNLLNSAKV